LHSSSQGSGEGSHVVDGVIVGATTSEGHGHGLILDADVLNGGGVGDCELHDKKKRWNVMCFERDASPPLVVLSIGWG